MHWEWAEIEMLRSAIEDGHTAGSVARLLGRSARSVTHEAKRLGFSAGLNFRATGSNIVKLRLPDETMQQLKCRAEELGMTCAGTARVIVTATLRD
jgi:hypothetical protein